MSLNSKWRKRIRYFQFAGIAAGAYHVLTRDSVAYARAELELENALKKLAASGSQNSGERFLIALEVEQKLREYIGLSTGGMFEDKQAILSGVQILELHRQIVEGD
jgi:hypothetical protein